MINEFIIQKLRKGDQSAFRTVVESCQDLVLNTCLGYLPNRSDAEDVAQEVFVEVFRSIRKYKSTAKFETWLYRIAINKCLDELRARKRVKRKSLFGAIVNTEAIQDHLGHATFDHPGVLMEQEAHTKALYAALDKLSDTQRTAFVLNKIEGKSYQEVAEIMETTVAAVESLLHRARKNLKVHLKYYYETQIVGS